MKITIITVSLLFFYTWQSHAATIDSTQVNKYWVMETGPCSNPYTIIRLYTAEDQLVREIVLQNIRMNASRKRIRHLNQLAAMSVIDSNATNVVAAVLKIKPKTIIAIK